MGVSKNSGTPKWMVYKGQAKKTWIIWGGKTPIFGNIHIVLMGGIVRGRS